MKFLTQGSSWEATKLVHYDEQTGYLYYLSNEMGHGTRHLYKLDSSNGVKQCVSCVDLGYNITAGKDLIFSFNGMRINYAPMHVKRADFFFSNYRWYNVEVDFFNSFEPKVFTQSVLCDNIAG